MSISSSSMRARHSDDIEADLRERHSHSAAWLLALCRYDETAALKLMLRCYAAQMGPKASRSVVDVWAMALRMRRLRLPIDWIRRLLMLDWDPFDGRPPDFEDVENNLPAIVRWRLLELEPLERAAVILVLHNGITVRDAAAVIGLPEPHVRTAYESGKTRLHEVLDPHDEHGRDSVSFLRDLLPNAQAGLNVPAFGYAWTRAKSHKRERLLKAALGTIGFIGLALAIVMITLGVLKLKDEPAARPGVSIPAERFFDKTK